MSKNTGIPYEILTQQIFQTLHDQSQIKNIKVQHNIELQGKQLKHQIDVYWEYELGGIIYRAIVQAKDWGQAVTQNQLLSFKAILDDLPGQPRGIFVTRTGYQSGAREYAEANGIKLYELREPTEKDMDGRIMSFRLRIHIISPKADKVEPIFDEVWASVEKNRLGFDPDDELGFAFGASSEQLILWNEAGQEDGDIPKIVHSLFPDSKEAMKPIVVERLFSEPTFIKTGNPSFPKAKLLGIRATISVERQDQESVLKGEDFIGFIMRDVIGDTITMLDKKNRPIR